MVHLACSNTIADGKSLAGLKIIRAALQCNLSIDVIKSALLHVPHRTRQYSTEGSITLK